MPTPSPQAALKALRDPSKALPAFGQVHDQKSGKFVKYDPQRITHTLQTGILDYYSNPPMTSFGQTKFLTVLTARQMGKSLTSEYGAYCKAAYHPAWDHVCIADTGDRANYLHGRVHHLHQRWPAQIRTKTVPVRESRQLTFDPLQGGRMRVLSGEAGAVGIGQSPDSFHASECAFWSDFAGSMHLIWPSLMNRDHALVVFECTPWESRTDWHEHCLSAKRGEGRNQYLFAPFWDGKLNERPWDSSWTLENTEIDMLNKYGSLGLRKEHLSFRRLMLSSDVQIRRNPELFNVFYPSDDIGCWVSSANAAIPAHVLGKHIERSHELHKWRRPSQTYEQPHPDAIYAIGADPCGHAARDHASFQILKCYEGEWTQVGVYADHSDPITFTRKLHEMGIRYNKALIVVESNGVGQACLSLLREWDYPNIYYEKLRRPGFTSTSKSVDQALGWLIDALMDEVVLNDSDTLEQLMSYKNDKRIEEGANSELVRGSPSKRRRDRHHWDKVSALIMAVIGARWVPRRSRPKVKEKVTNVVMFPTWKEWDAYQEGIAKDKELRTKKGTLRGSMGGSWYKKGPGWR